MFKKTAMLISVLAISGTTLADTIAVGGSVTNTKLRKVVCKNVTTGQSITIKDIKHPYSWDCGTAGLLINEKDVIRETLIGTFKVNSSCKSILAVKPASINGTYWIHPTDGSSSFQTYCDMTQDGGGWTLVAKLFEFTLPAIKRNASTLLNDTQPSSGQEGKLADATINSLDYKEVRVIPSGAPKYVTYFFQPGIKVWDFSAHGAGNLSGVPICEDPALTKNCVTRNGVINGSYTGYRNYNGSNNYAFVLNHPNNLGYAGRVPYAEDYGISATVWVR